MHHSCIANPHLLLPHVEACHHGARAVTRWHLRQWCKQDRPVPLAVFGEVLFGASGARIALDLPGCSLAQACAGLGGGPYPPPPGVSKRTRAPASTRKEALPPRKIGGPPPGGNSRFSPRAPSSPPARP
eukprot:scaffold1378_cov24-Tisochrysis_lutea.AAC.3